MRRYTTTLAVAGLLASLVAGVAVAAAPANRSYSGIGRVYWQQGGKWVRHGSASFQFRTDKPYNCGKNNGLPRGADCQYITRFVGSYRGSCTSGSAHVKEFNIPINQKTNAFSARFNRGGTGRVWGSFHSGGATVNYRVKLSGCSVWVRGKAS
jgi:hypothetical protein